MAYEDDRLYVTRAFGSIFLLTGFQRMNMIIEILTMLLGKVRVPLFRRIVSQPLISLRNKLIGIRAPMAPFLYDPHRVYGHAPRIRQKLLRVFDRRW